MNRSLFVTGFTLALLLSVRAIAEESKKQADVILIPLDEIWGYNLPGTRDVAGISLPETDPQQGVIGRTDAMFRRQREHNIEQWRRALMAKPPEERALSGFVLAGQPDFFTLQSASNRADGMMRQAYQKRGIESDTIQTGKDVTLVFFTHPASYYVRLKKVERNDDDIKVLYEFEPHASPEVTVHFALVPLGKLPAGEFQVHFEQVPFAQKHREAGFEPIHPEAFEFICRPFSFTIGEPPSPEDEARAEGATQIPLTHIWAYEMPGTRDIRELEPNLDTRNLSRKELILSSRVNHIAILLSQVPNEDEKAGPAFVVKGTGNEALKNAHAVFVDNRNAKSGESLPRDTELSLVFYVYLTGWHAQIKSVERSSGNITVKYQFVAPRPISDSTARFALIPIGKLPEGPVQLKIKQLPPVDLNGQPTNPKRDPDRFVCSSALIHVR